LAGAQNERKDFPPGKANEKRTDHSTICQIAILAMSGYAEGFWEISSVYSGNDQFGQRSGIMHIKHDAATLPEF
jgi:hypothetical protein